MAVTAAELVQYGKSAIDLYMKNKPIDSVNAERPLLKKLLEKSKETLGGKDKLVKQVRKGNDSNFQDFYGSDVVDYNRKDTLEQSKFDYTNFHDGFSLHEDDFIRNGVEVKADGPGKEATKMEKATITNIFEEQNETLRLGFEESWDVAVHCGNTTDISALVPKVTSNPIYGLSDMVSFAPSSGTYAAIARSNAYWQNHAATDLAVSGTPNILQRMRAAWRACTKYGGRPDFIPCGSGFFDAYTDYMMSTYGQVNYSPIAKKGVEGAEGEVYYQGVPLVWDPTFDKLQDNSIESGTHNWKNRCYFLNMTHIKLMPIKGQHMQSRTPPRVYNKYEYYWALTTRFYLINERPTAHAALRLA